jgi:uncharacterized membrane protein
MPKPGKINRRVIILAGLSLFLSALELVIPKPVPILRLGLANLALLIGLEVLPFGEYLLLIGLKVLLQGLLSGTLLSPVILLSAGGSLASGLFMRILFRFRGRFLGMTGISLAGALASNLVQLALAGWLLTGIGILYLAPPFLALGAVTSLLLGLLADRFSRDSLWLTRHRREVLKP